MPRPSSAINASQRAATNMKRVIGQNIKAHRIALGLSREELAKKFGVSRTALSQFEIGLGEVNAGDLPRLANLLGISTLKFFERSAEDASPTPEQTRRNNEERKNEERMIARLAQQRGWRVENPGYPSRSSSPDFILTPEGSGIMPGGPEEIPRDLEAMPQSQALSELMSQIAQLSGEDQEIIRRIVSALHGARSANSHTGSSAVTRQGARRVSKKRG